MKIIKITKTILISLAAIFALLNFSVAEAINHDFTGLPLDSNGWTDYQSMIASREYNDSRVVFVSNLGNDLTGQIHGISSLTFTPDGRFNSTGTIYPYATIAAAYAQCRSGYADIMLLKTGDEWDVGFGGAKIKSGVSQTARHIISSYGTGERPALKDIMINTYNSHFSIFANIKLYSLDWRTAGRAIDIGGNLSNQLFEDVLMEQVNNAKVDGSPGEKVAFRRCVFTEGQGYDGMIYIADMVGFLFEESVFHEPHGRDDPEETRFWRFFYVGGEQLANNTQKDIIMRGNIFYRGERESFDFRSSGTADNNLIVATDTIGFGGGGSNDGVITSGHVTNNVFAEGLPNRSNGGSFINYRNIDTGSIIGNIWTDGETGNYNQYFTAISINGSGDRKIAKNLKISQNIVYGRVGRAYRIGTEMDEIENFEISDNAWQFNTASTAIPIFYHSDWTNGTGDRFLPFTYRNNKYWSTAAESLWFPGATGLADWMAYSGETGAQAIEITYPDPNRSVRSYNASLGGNPSTDEFMDIAIAQHRGNWSENYTAQKVNNHIRAGFGKASVEYTYDNMNYPTEPTCQESKSYCYTEEDCSAQGGFYYVSGTHLPDPQCFSVPQGGATCASTPSLCTIDDCEINGWFWQNGVCREGIVIRADVDGSSEITTTDALLTLRNSLGLSMTGTAWRVSVTTGDVNCDGVSNSTDALLILRHSLGLSMSGTGWCE